MFGQTVPSAPKTASTSNKSWEGALNTVKGTLGDFWDSILKGTAKVSIGKDQKTVQVGGLSYTKTTKGTEVRMNNGNLGGVNGEDNIKNSPFNFLSGDNTAVIMMFIAGAVVLFLFTRQ